MKEYDVLQVDADASIEKMVQRLDSLQKMVDTPKVVAAAINSAARSTKNKIVKDTKERYATANDSVYSSSSTLKVDAATGGDLTATLHSSGSIQQRTQSHCPAGAGRNLHIGGRFQACAEMGRKVRHDPY